MRDDGQDDLFGKPPTPEKDPIIVAAERMREGMQRAERHAEKDAPGWTERAALHLRAYAAAHGEFLIEDARESFVERPANLKSWGPATTVAKNRKWIVKTGGVRAAKSSNLSPAILWRAGP